MSGNAAFTRLGTHNMVLPPEGPKAYPNTLDFRSSNTQKQDYTGQITAGFVSFLQSIYVDNSLNDDALVIVCDQINQRVVIPRKSCAYMPLFITDSAVLTFTTTQSGDLTVPIVVSNVPVTPYVWSVE